MNPFLARPCSLVGVAPGTLACCGDEMLCAKRAHSSFLDMNNNKAIKYGQCTTHVGIRARDFPHTGKCSCVPLGN